MGLSCWISWDVETNRQDAESAEKREEREVKMVAGLCVI